MSHKKFESIVFLHTTDSDPIENTKSTLLFKTENFAIKVYRNNQKVPGILEVSPINLKLKTWKDLEISHHIELNKIQRICESLLIKTFHSEAEDYTPHDDERLLINSYAREMKGNQEEYFKWMIYPRYGMNQTMMVSPSGIRMTKNPLEKLDDEVALSDPKPGKPFEYENPLKLSFEHYKTLVASLRQNLPTIFESLDIQTEKEHFDDCFNCKHPRDHVDEAGVMQIEINMKEGAQYHYNISLDARDQRHEYRGYIIPVNHIKALRYADDMEIALMHKLANPYKRAAEKLRKKNSEETLDPQKDYTYDHAVLMNLYNEKTGGPHVHLHVFSRDSEEPHYELEYAMNANEYVPLTKDAFKKKEIVNEFSRLLFLEILADPTFSKMDLNFTYVACRDNPTFSNQDHNIGLFSREIAAKPICQIDATEQHMSENGL